MFKFLSKSNRKNTTAAITNLTIVDRENIVMLREEGIKPADISEELGIPVEQICRVIALERSKRIKLEAKSTDDTKEMQELKETIQKLKLQDKKDELEHNIEMSKLRRERRLAPHYEEEDDDGDSMSVQDQMLTSLLSGLAGGARSPQPATPPTLNSFPTSPAPQPKVELSDVEIEQILEDNAKALKPIQKLPDETLKALIRSKFDMIGEQTITRAVELIKKKSFKVKN